VPLYFAYGANMVRHDMARRCPGARLLGAAALGRHRFAIIRGGHGTVLPQPGATVHGVLWRIGRADRTALDRYEEVARGLYRRAPRVVTWRGRAVGALVYIAAAQTAGRARPAYLAAIVGAARAQKFSADYVAALEAIASTSAGVRPASRSARRVRARSRLA
jgi:hypothetical protein